MSDMENVARGGSTWKLTSRFYLSFVEIMIEVSEFQKVLRILSRFLARCKLKKDVTSMKLCYESMGRVNSKLKKFHKAKNCYLKMLKIALRKKDYFAELRAYD